MGPHVVVDPEVVASYTTDWTGRFVGHSPAVVRPGSTEEVAGVIAVCRELGLAVVPQGGNTGLVGGGVPLRGEVVLSLGRLGDAGAGRRRGRPDHRRRRGDPGRPAAGRRRGRLVLRRGHRQPRLGHGGGHGRHQRRRPARHPLRGHPGPVGGARGGARDRRGDVPPRGAGEGQHRVRLARAGVRERGDPGRGDPGPAAAGTAPAPPDGGPAGLPHRPRRPARRPGCSAARSPPSRRASWCWRRGWTWSARSPGRDCPSPTAIPPTCWSRRPTGPTPPRPWPRPPRPPATCRPWPWPPNRDGGPSCGSYRESHTIGHQHPGVPAQAGRDPPPGLAGRVRRPGARGGGRGRGRGPHLAVRPRRGRQHPRQRDRPRARTTIGSTTRCSGWWPSSAGASAPSTASARPRSGGSTCRGPRPSRRRSGPIKAALDPDGVLNPNVLLSTGGH